MERSEVTGGIAEQFLSNWTSSIFRNRCTAQIDSARSEANPQVNSDDPVEKFLAQKSSEQLEEFVFEQSKSREDYLSLVAEMLMMLRQHRRGPSVNTHVHDSDYADEAAGFTPDDDEDLKNHV